MRYRNKEERAGSHLVVLVKVFDKSDGDVLEVGTGLFSTPVLHWLSGIYHRHVYSYENNKEWYELAKKYESDYHHIIFIDDYSKIPKKHFGMVFIDQSPSHSRRFVTRDFANLADYIVVHDTEIENQGHYHMERTLNTFKYRFDYTKAMPHTSVVSNQFEVKL